MDEQPGRFPAAEETAIRDGEAALPKPRRTRRAAAERQFEPEAETTVRDATKGAADLDGKADPLPVSSRTSAVPDTELRTPAPMLTQRMPIYVPLYAAALCTALGLGGLLGAQFKQAREAALAVGETVGIDRALPWKREMAEADARDDLRALRGELAALRANNDQFRQMEAQRHAGELRVLRATLEAQKAETASLKADIAARFDRADRSDRDAIQRADKTAERIDRLEKRLADPLATSTVAKTIEPPKPEKVPVKGMVLREAMKGVALVETRRGLLEVVPGDTIPGAGRVETIEKRGGRWRVVTTTGVIDDSID